MGYRTDAMREEVGAYVYSKKLPFPNKEGGHWIASLFCNIDAAKNNRDNFWADAHLIAAAPEMYEALGIIRCWFDAFEDCVCDKEEGSTCVRHGRFGKLALMTHVDKALAKARGEENE